MRLLRVRGVEIRVNLLFLLMLVITALCGYLGEMLIIVGVVLLHEGAHVIAAKVRGVEVIALEVLPFGAVARLTHAPMRTADELITALAGPGINIISLVLAAAIELLFPAVEIPELFIRYSMTLAGFNLLPALPLDGGRALRALLTPLLGNVRATKLACVMGDLLAGLLVGFGVFMLLYEGWFNLTLFVIGGFIFLSVRKEKRALSYQMIHDVMRKSDRLMKEKTLPIKQIAVYYNMSVGRLMGMRSPGVVNVFTVVDEHLNFRGHIVEGELLSLADSSMTAGEYLLKR